MASRRPALETAVPVARVSPIMTSPRNKSTNHTFVRLSSNLHFATRGNGPRLEVVGTPGPSHSTWLFAEL